MSVRLDHIGVGLLGMRRYPQIHEHPTTATAMRREMDMHFGLEQTEAAMKEAGRR